MIEELIHLDESLFLYLNNLGNQSWDNLWLLITNKFFFGSLLALGLLFLVYKNYGWKGLILVIILTSLLITFTDQVTNLFKRGFERTRPCRTVGVMEHMRFIATRCGKYGFFSGHASNSMAVAIFGGLLLKPFYKNLIFVLISISIIVAYSRIYVGVHYPLDIFCGMLFGIFSGYLFYRIANYVLQRYQIKVDESQ